ncbi:hypothetical protein [Streptomyces sp. AB3(2024)]|uniref:Rv1733c family protein n=1 Tax=Streptomyces sp. AB3(2024) TaxID=3317321 RepID=UPI0035A3A899
MLACLLAVICGVAAGRAAWTDAARDTAETARHRHVVTAVTVGETTYRAGTGPSTRPITMARATWRDPAHRVHTETVPVTAAPRTGDTVSLWADDDGNTTTTPPGTPEIALKAIGLGTGAFVGIALVAGAVLYVRLRLVNARSAQEWEREWESVEPKWSGRLRPGQGACDD